MKTEREDKKHRNKVKFSLGRRIKLKYARRRILKQK